jgi:soluble lytic murein transglycosylase
MGRGARPSAARIVIRRLLAIAALLALAAVGASILLEHTMPDWYARYRYPLRYAWIIRAHAHNYHLDPALLAAVVYTESRFRPQTVSPAGALGLMQLLPATARGIAERTGGSRFVESDLLDPELNVRYGAWYLEHLTQRYRGRTDAEDLALAAYNAGQGTVDAWIASTPAGSPVRIRYRETRDYIASVRRVQRIYRRAFAHELGYR